METQPLLLFFVVCVAFLLGARVSSFSKRCVRVVLYAWDGISKRVIVTSRVSMGHINLPWFECLSAAAVESTTTTTSAAAAVVATVAAAAEKLTLIALE
jgi:hypothetical protein